MPNTVTMKVEGLDALRNALLRLPGELQKGPLRRAVAATAKVVQQQAIDNAPEDTGVLKKSVYRAHDKANSSGVQEAYIVGVRYGKRFRKRGQDAWYWWHVEFGTSRAAAHPFMRPAFDNTHEAQIEAMRKTLAKGIDDAVAKLVKRNAK